MRDIHKGWIGRWSTSFGMRILVLRVVVEAIRMCIRLIEWLGGPWTNRRFILPRYPGTNSQTLDRRKARLAWVGNSNLEPGIECTQQPAPPATTLVRALSNKIIEEFLFVWVDKRGLIHTDPRRPNHAVCVLSKSKEFDDSQNSEDWLTTVSWPRPSVVDNSRGTIQGFPSKALRSLVVESRRKSRTELVFEKNLYYFVLVKRRADAVGDRRWHCKNHTRPQNGDSFDKLRSWLFHIGRHALIFSFT